jgi:hypothetical protein
MSVKPQEAWRRVSRCNGVSIRSLQPPPLTADLPLRGKLADATVSRLGARPQTVIKIDCDARPLTGGDE